MPEHYIHRARDVEMMIKEHGFEKGAYRSLMRMAEDNVVIRQELEEMRKVIDKMADIVANIATVGARVKDEMEAMRRKFYPDNEANPNKRWS